tara:strand:- start:1032 stop:1367 length:336 start_codon:yes stop_codon:yes gene_type:complete
MENNDMKFEKLEKQIGTLKFVVLIMAVALIYNSAKKTGMLGEYKIYANTISAKNILLKGDNNKNLGKFTVYDNEVSITLSNKNNQLNISPEKIKFLEVNDSIDKIVFTIPK